MTRYTFTPLSAEDRASIDFKVYPTIVTDEFHVNAPVNTAFEITLYNVAGLRLFIWYEQHSEVLVDMKGRPAGMYFLKITSKGQSKTYRIIKN